MSFFRKQKNPLDAINEIDFTLPETPAKPKKPVCDLFERQPDRPPVWCNDCGRHIDLHKNREEDDEDLPPAPEPKIPFDPFARFANPRGAYERK